MRPMGYSRSSWGGDGLTIIGWFNSTGSGYGRTAIHLLRALWRRGVDAEVVNAGDVSSPREFDGDVLVVTTPDFWPNVRASGRFWGLTMWETSRCPPYWVDIVNDHADGVIVPSGFCQQVFQESGVEVPVHVVPLGVDAQEFPYMHRPERRPYVFLMLGELGGFRKGWAYAYQAFWQAFRGNPRVVMVFKTRGPGMLFSCAERNVEIIDAEYGPEMMRELYYRADCFVFPSVGEGFGLPPREAAATGLPVLATDWSGLQEGGIENYAYPIRVTRMEEALYGPQDIWGLCGEWAMPDTGHLAQVMAWVHEHREEAKAQGRRAAAWVQANCTWEMGAKILLQAVEKCGMDQE